MAIQLFIYLSLTFLGLFLGGLFTNPGTASEWYAGLQKAPWTPPGPAFGIAWTLIGITWSIWAAKVSHATNRYIKRYWAIWLLNFLWNPIFFGFHATLIAGLIIFSLLLAVGESLILTQKELGLKYSIWVYPYVIWLVLANSLNWYIVFSN